LNLLPLAVVLDFFGGVLAFFLCIQLRGVDDD
jgi:hypothetical protein